MIRKSIPAIVLILLVVMFTGCDIIKLESKKDKKKLEAVESIVTVDNTTQTKIITNDAEIAQLLLKIETLNHDLESLTAITASKDIDIENLSENNLILKKNIDSLTSEKEMMTRLQHILMIVAGASVLLNGILIIVMIRSAKRRRKERSLSSVAKTSYTSKVDNIFEDNDEKDLSISTKKSKPTTTAKSKPTVKKVVKNQPAKKSTKTDK